MPSLRIGIDVGGTFTHGVVLRPPGEVIAKAVTPTTHAASRGVAEGVAETLRLLLAELDRQGIARSEIELVAHSTTQATNALLEGDVSGVHLMALAPPGEHGLVRRALGTRLLDVGNGHSVRIWPKLLQDWEMATAENFPAGVPVAAASSRRNTSPGNGGMGAADTSESSEPLASVPLPTNWNRPGWDGVNVPPGFMVSERLPVAVVQPLAGKHELREEAVATHYRACGHGAVCASEITQVLGLQARTRTAVVNAAMLPKMLATADFTERAVGELLPGVPLQVVRGDGGAMSLAELRRQPVHSLLSGPAAGASAALHRSGLANAVFIEVGGTSTDITLVKDGRVRHRYATVGGQRLLVPALDLRTVAVGGGSMLRADTALFGPRSAHIAGLPYLFQAVQRGLTVSGAEQWTDPKSGTPYVVAKMSDGSLAAFTMTDFKFERMLPAKIQELFEIRLTNGQRKAISQAFVEAGKTTAIRVPKHELSRYAVLNEWPDPVKLDTQKETEVVVEKLLERTKQRDAAPAEIDVCGIPQVAFAFAQTCNIVSKTIRELALSHDAELTNYRLLGGGGGAHVMQMLVTIDCHFGAGSRVLKEHGVISAIGAALAVTCVSLSKSVASPTGQDIAALAQEVEARLAAQGAERVSTDYEFDQLRQVLTVTGRGNRPYERDSQPLDKEKLRERAIRLMWGSDYWGTKIEPVWESTNELLWCGKPVTIYEQHSKKTPAWMRRSINKMLQSVRKRQHPFEPPVNNAKANLGLALDRSGRVLWQGRLARFYPHGPGQRDAVLAEVISQCTAYTDGGPALPGLALVSAGRLIPLELGDPALLAEVLRWERLPDGASGCFIVRG